MKRFLFIVSFLSLFFIQSPCVLAQSTQEAPKSIFEIIWQAISGIFNPTPVEYIGLSNNKDNLLEDPKKGFTSYKSQDGNVVNKANSNADVIFNKGVQLYHVIKGDPGYTDDVVAYNCDNVCTSIEDKKSSCSPIKKSTLVYYFYTKNIPILFKTTDPKNPVDYSSVNLTKQKLINDDSCYTRLYDNLPQIPFGESDSGENSIGGASIQLNKALRNPVPYNQQGGDLSVTDSDTTANTKIVAEDNNKQTKNMANVLTPESNKVCDYTGSNSLLLDNVRKNLNPDKWLLEADDSTETPASRESEGNVGGCKNGGHGRGMSQYGAQGMAIMGYTYKNILFAYYGDDTLGVGLTTIDSSKDEIKVALIQNDKTYCQKLVDQYPNRFKYTNNGYTTTAKKICPQVQNPSKNEHKYDTLTLSIEDYLKGLGEMPSSWQVEAHKAQVVAARTYSYTRTHGLTNTIRDCSYDQVFRCKKLFNHLTATTNHTTAVDQTKGEILLKNGKRFSTEYSSCHGKASLTEPYFDGTEFERAAKAPLLAGGEVCSSSIGSSGPTGGSGGGGIGATLVGDLYVFSDSYGGGRIKKDYDIGNIDDGKWLTTYKDGCRIDSRVVPSLDLMYAAIDTDITNNKMRFSGSCYRSIAQQTKLWNAGLAKGRSAAENAKWVARPGKSAHHTGRAIDFRDKNGRLDRSSSVYKWMLKNANRYGWYNYKREPWHWEYNP